MSRPNYSSFTACKTTSEKLEILKKAHLQLPQIDNDYMPDDLYGKMQELKELMLKYIWQWSKESEG